MGVKSILFGVTLKGYDLLSAPLMRAVRGIKGVDAAAAQMRGLAKLTKDMKGYGEAVQRAGAYTLGAGVAGAAAIGLTDLPRDAMQAEHALRRVANTAGIGARELAPLAGQLGAVARQTNQLRSELVGGLGVLTSKGMGFADARAVLPVIGRAATATGAQINDLAAAVFSANTNLGIGVKEAGRFVNMLATAGDQGGFELPDMAKWTPSLTGLAQSLKMQGMEAGAQLGAGLQVALYNSRDADEAANRMVNFLGGLTSPEVIKNFRKFGVDVSRELDFVRRTGGDLMEHMTRVTMDVTGGDAVKTSAIFGDRESRMFVLAMTQNAAKYREIRGVVAAAGREGGRDIVGKQFGDMMGTTLERWKAFKIGVSALAMPTVERGLARVNAALTTINANPLLQRLAVGGVVGLLATGSGLVALGTVARTVGGAVTAFGRLSMGASALKAGFLGVAPAGSTAVAGLMRVGGALRAGVVAARAFNLAMLANPVGLGIAAGAVAIAGVGLAVRKYWGPITGFVRGFGRMFAVAFAPALPALRQFWGLLKWTPLGLLVQAVVGAGRWVGRVVPQIGRWFRDLIRPVTDVGRSAENAGQMLGYTVGRMVAGVVNAPGKMLAAARNMMTSLWRGITGYAHLPVQALTGVVTRLRNLLPFSPAKDGPLRDLHRVKITQTVALGMRPDPMVGAMRRAAGLTLMAASPAAALVGSAGRGAPQPSARSAGGAPVVIHNSFQVGGRTTTDGAAAFGAAWPEIEGKLRRVVRDELPRAQAGLARRAARTGYER